MRVLPHIIFFLAVLLSIGFIVEPAFWLLLHWPIFAGLHFGLRLILVGIAWAMLEISAKEKSYN